MSFQNDPKAITALAHACQVAQVESGPRNYGVSRLGYTYTVYVLPDGRMVLQLDTTIFSSGAPERIVGIARMPAQLTPEVFFTSGRGLQQLLQHHRVTPFSANAKLPGHPPAYVIAIWDRQITDWSPDDVVRIAQYLAATSA